LNRTKLLNQQEARQKALKEVEQLYKEPSAIKYDLFNDKDNCVGYVEYRPNTDNIRIVAISETSVISGNVLKSLRDILTQLIGD